MPKLLLHVVKTILQLFDDFFGSGRIALWANARAGTLRVLIFDNYPLIDGVGPTLRDGELVPAFKFDARVFLNERKLLFDFNADLFFLIRHYSRSSDLIGKLRRSLGNQFV